MKILIGLAMIPFVLYGLQILLGTFFGGLLLMSDDRQDGAGQGCGCLLMLIAIAVVAVIFLY